jgi:hypothetical protein
MAPPYPASTGLASLDRVVEGLRPGDNVVWQVDSVEDYVPFVRPFVADALRAGKRLVYFRFARHAPLVDEGAGAEVHRLSPAVGFESFTTSIHQVIEQAGPGAYYVFDCLSDLAADWYSDLMLGNFFMVTCPYLYELDTVTYFALLRDSHSHEAVDSIRNTTQLLLDVFRRGDQTYVHPLKVFARHSPTMYLPHAQEADGFRPLTESAVLSEVLADLAERRLDAVARHDLWDRRFQQARDALEAVRAGAAPEAEARAHFDHLLRMMLTRDERVAELAGRWLDLTGLLAIRRRMIGTGLVGGKAVGMLLARAILVRSDPRWARRLEPHDSWFVGSDVFYTYLVRNGCWRARREQRSAETFLEGAADARERILGGLFPEFILRQFRAMLEYYGQSPIIVRSSSLLEDGFGNAFTGKYDSVFCPNQGSPAERLDAFLAAVRQVYASAMSEEALRYREHRGLLDRDEQMAILVQRVSGAIHGGLFFPQVAGVALSYNPWAWNPGIDPQAGMIRLVFGLGTRAVDRSDDDYTRVVALNAPLTRPEASLDEVTEHAQRRVDLIDLEANRFDSRRFDELARGLADLPVDLFATTRRDGPPVLTFDKLLAATPFVDDVRAMVRTLADAYRYPVDVEFTANFLPGGRFRLNLVQCRPLQVKEGGVATPPPGGPAGAGGPAREPRAGGGPEHQRAGRPGDLRRPGRVRPAGGERPVRGRPGGRAAHPPRAGRAPADPAPRPGAVGDEHDPTRRADVVRRDPAGVGHLRGGEDRHEGGPGRLARLALLQRPRRVEHALPRRLPGPPRLPARRDPAPLRAEPARRPPARGRPPGGDRARGGLPAARGRAVALAQRGLREAGGPLLPRAPGGGAGGARALASPLPLSPRRGGGGSRRGGRTPLSAGSPA